MTRDERSLYFDYAMQYYVAGRFTLLTQLSPVCANILHHAIELFLKGYFARDYSKRKFDQFKNEYRHNLPKIWDAFKMNVADANLDTFDSLILELHKFEDIRYPDRIISEGASIVVGIERQDVELTTHSVTGDRPRYQTYIEEVDGLVAAILQKSSANKRFYTSSLHRDALDYLYRHSKTFLPGTDGPVLP